MEEARAGAVVRIAAAAAVMLGVALPTPGTLLAIVVPVLALVAIVLIGWDWGGGDDA